MECDTCLNSRPIVSENGIHYACCLSGRAAEGGHPMLVITLEVDAPEGMSMAIKEHLAILVERYGDTRVVDVRVKGERNGNDTRKAGNAR